MDDVMVRCCPFCGSTASVTYYGDTGFVICDKQECQASKRLGEWNTRPIEDAMNAAARQVTLLVDAQSARIDGLEAQLAGGQRSLTAIMAEHTETVSQLDSMCRDLDLAAETHDAQAARIAELEAQISAVDVSGLPLRNVTKSQLAGTIMVQSLMISSFEGEITALRAQLAALRPWTDVGKRAVRHRWWVDLGILSADKHYCRICRSELSTEHDHPDFTACPIPALLAELDAADE